MSRTGSTYVRRWPINWGTRLRLVLVAGALLVTMTAAHADWVPRSVTGIPNDVKVWAPGVFSVATSSGAYLFQADGGGMNIPAPPGVPAVGSRFTKTGCFAGFFNDSSAVVTPTNCPLNLGTSTFPDIGNTVVAGVKISESGAGYALGFDSGNFVSALALTPSESGMWGVVGDLGGGSPETLGVVSQGGVEHALVAIDEPGQAKLTWFADGASRPPYTLPDAAPPHDVQSIDLFNAGDPTPTALFGFAGTLYRGTLLSGTLTPFQPVPLPTPANEVAAVDVNPGAGSVYGDGFGMALVKHAGGASLLSAVPAGQAQDIGTEWRVNSTFNGAVVAPRYLSCQGAHTCVVALKQGPPNNLLVYTNAHPPTLGSDPGIALPEGTVDFPFAVRASDDDGDALRVTVSGGQPAVLTFTETDVNGGKDLKISTGFVCANTRVPIVIAASDGLQAHDQVRTLNFDVIHTEQASAPIVPPSPISVQAGTADLSITAADPVNVPCPPVTGFTWSALTPNAPALVNGGGGTAVFRTPRTLCQQHGAAYSYSVVAHDSSGLASQPAGITIQVRPWGLPEAPFAAGTRLHVDAGSSGSLGPPFIHQCTASAGFPGVDTIWDIKQGAQLNSHVQLLTEDNVPVTSSRTITPRITVKTEACASANLELEVRHSMHDGSGLLGPPSTVQVTVDPRLTEFKDAKLQFTSLDPKSDSISGETSAQDLNCVEERGGVDVRITLTRDDGRLIDEQLFPLGKPWRMLIPPSCGGQSFLLKGQLVARSNPQTPAPPVTEKTVTITAAPVELAELNDQKLVATCNGPASGIVEQPPLAGLCAELPISWEYFDGPPLLQSIATGQRVELTTKDTDFGELIGQVVRMNVSVNSGVVSSRLQKISIVAEPFVTMERSVENAVGADTDLIGVSVELHNRTECDVRSVDHTEYLEGADYVPDSARFNDIPIEKERIEVAGESLTFHDLPLVAAANGTGRLTYVVRPRLLGKTRIEGETKVRGVSVSQPVQVPVSGCGCEGGGSGFAALGLAGLAAVLRRRRAS